MFLSNSAFGGEPAPLFAELRALILCKYHPARERAVRAIFERQPFGELERLVTTTILNLVKRVARKQLENEQWLGTIAKDSGRSFQEMRVVALEFLEGLRFTTRQPTALYFYRELQSLRDPLHFRPLPRVSR